MADYFPVWVYHRSRTKEQETFVETSEERLTQFLKSNVELSLWQNLLEISIPKPLLGLEIIVFEDKRIKQYEYSRYDSAQSKQVINTIKIRPGQYCVIRDRFDRKLNVNPDTKEIADLVISFGNIATGYIGLIREAA